MSNANYDYGREGILDETINMNSGDIRVMLVKSTYTFSNAHKFLSDLGSVDNGRSSSLTGKTFSAGVFDANDTALSATSAVACNALVIFKHTGSDATARVVSYIDTATLGLPDTPNAGQGVTIQWANTSNKIFKL
jgi:hypothetical protein